MLGNVLLLLAPPFPPFFFCYLKYLFYEGAKVVMPSCGGKVNFRKQLWRNRVQNVVG